ncbi:hypothetical protein [Rhodoflexus sp.]
MRKELKLGIYVISVWLTIKILSHGLSFNPQGELYAEYYYNLMPVSFIDILLVLYLLRTIIVFIIHFYSNRSAKG